MGLPSDFKERLKLLNPIIRGFELYNENGPVNIDALLKALKISVRYETFKDFFLEGTSSPNPLKKHEYCMIINPDHPKPIQRKTKAHELGHILFHQKELPLQSHPNFSDKLIEREANYAAAYILVPGPVFEAGGRDFSEIAKFYQVPYNLVQMRYEIFIKLKQ